MPINHAVQRADQLAGFGELRVKVSGDLKRVGHIRIIIDQIGHATSMMVVKPPLLARGQGGG